MAASVKLRRGAGPQPQTVVFFCDAEGALVLRSNGLEVRLVTYTAN